MMFSYLDMSQLEQYVEQRFLPEKDRSRKFTKVQPIEQRGLETNGRDDHDKEPNTSQD